MQVKDTPAASAPPALEPASEFERALLALPGVKVLRNEPLADHVSMGVGGPARWFAEAADREALRGLLALLRGGTTPWSMLGGGSNTLFGDAGFEGVIVHLGRGFRTIEPGPDAETVRAGAGANVSAVMNFAKRRGLAGAEFFAGIPGTLGGALAGNAGAGGEDACSIADEVEVIDSEGRETVRKRGEFQFAYRFSQLRDDVILGATLRLRADSMEAIEARIQKHLSKRWEQPVGERSSGCMFKNPPGDFAGRLIDQAGLKGLRIGGMRVSEEHANFMINDGSGTAAEIEQLIGEVRRRVMEKAGVELDGEVRFL